jgi:periplasmic protein TonB
MKTCPTCQRQYDDEDMKFCLDDGSLLLDTVATTVRSDDNQTWQMPSQSVEPPPTLVAPTTPPLRTPPDTRPTAASFSVETPRRGPGALLWIALALILGGSGIAIALIVMRGRQPNRTADLAAANSSPNQNASIAETTPAIDSNKSIPSTQSSPANRPTERPTQSAKSTPAVRETPARSVAAEEPSPPPKSDVPRAPISGGVLNGKAVRLVQPPYPAIARSAHASGQVRVQVLIDENGNVISASAISGHPLLQGAAAAAARQSKFTPTKLSGQAVKVTGVIIYNFVAQ